MFFTSTTITNIHNYSSFILLDYHKWEGGGGGGGVEVGVALILNILIVYFLQIICCWILFELVKHDWPISQLDENLLVENYRLII